MNLTNANKALIATLLLSVTLVLMSYNFSVLKTNEQLAETYFDIIEEDLKPIEEEETLEDILESLDHVLVTNKAYNTTKKYDDFEDEEFKSTIEKIRNRDSRIEQIDTRSSNENEGKTTTEASESFNSINDIIAKRSKEKRAASGSENGANKNSSISYSLVNRTAAYLPPPIYLCEQHGKVVITITVNGEGHVINATVNGASSTSNGCLVDHALEYAKASQFDTSNKAQQIGTITFLFQGK